jgi:type 1 glutamine amidotransferase
MQVLVLCDDKWHPAQTPRAGLAPLENVVFTFDYIEHAGAWSAPRMKEYPVVLLAKANNISSTDERPWMTEEVETALHDYVRSGHGLLAIHSGTAGYRDHAMLRALLGGVFLRHPPQCQVTIEPQAGHPLTASSTPFTLKDEHYLMALDDATADVFLTTTSEHGVEPGGWTRRQGAGRVCVLSPGHNLEVWLHPAYQALISNALHWCGQRSPADS